MRKRAIIFITVLFSFFIAILYIVNASVIGDYAEKETLKILENRLVGIKLLIENFNESRRFFSTCEKVKIEKQFRDKLKEAEGFLSFCNLCIADGIFSKRKGMAVAVSYLRAMGIYAVDSGGSPVYQSLGSGISDFSFAKALIEDGGTYVFFSGEEKRVLFWSLFKPWKWKLFVPVYFKEHYGFISDVKKRLLQQIGYISSADYYVNVYDRDGGILVRSANAVHPDDEPTFSIMHQVFEKKEGRVGYTFSGMHKVKMFSFIPSVGWYVVLTAYPYKISSVALSEFLRISFPPLLSVVGIFLLLTFLLWRRIVAVPLFAVGKGFEELERGNYEYTIEPLVVDTKEMKEVVDGFNKMMARLAENERTLVAYYQKLEVANAEISLRHEELKRMLKRLEVLSKIVSAVGKLNTKRDIAQTTAEMLSGFERCKNISILLKDKDKLRLIAYVGDPKSRVEEVSFDRGIVGLAFTSKKLKNIPDVTKEPHYMPDDPNVRSEIACPLLGGDDAIGVIDVESEHASFFNIEDEILLMLVSRYLVVTFKRVDMVDVLFRSVRNEKLFLEFLEYAIRNFSFERVVRYVCRRIKENRGYGNVSFYLRKGNKLELSYVYGIEMPEDIHTISWGMLDIEGKGISARCARTGELQNVPNVLEDPDFVRDGKDTRSELSIPVRIGDEVVGVFDIESAEFNAFGKDDEEFMSAVADVIGTALYRLNLKKELEDSVRMLEGKKRVLESRTGEHRKSLEEIERYISEIENTSERLRIMEETLKKAYTDTVRAIAKTVELKDPYMEGHSERVAKYAFELGRSMGLDEESLKTLLHAAVLHDIGRIAVRGWVLNKKDKLGEDEYEEVKMHTVIGSDFLKNVDYLREVAVVVRHHHEWWNGRGYPDGLKGEEIPVLSRIIAVVDAYDAMRTDRPFRKALTKEEALCRIEEMAGVQFDPDIVKYFCGIMRADKK